MRTLVFGRETRAAALFFYQSFVRSLFFFRSVWNAEDTHAGHVQIESSRHYSRYGFGR